MPKSTRPATRWDWAESENPWRYGGLSRTLDIDDLVSITSIEVDEQIDNTFSLALASTDYELLPRNAALGSEPAPYTQIDLTPYGTQYRWLPNARVKVTGIWGWPAVPQAIRIATIKFTAIMRNEGPDATGRLMELDQVVEQSPEGKIMAYQLMRAYNTKVPF